MICSYSIAGLDYCENYTGNIFNSVVKIIEKFTAFFCDTPVSKALDVTPIPIKMVEFDGLRLKAKKEILLKVNVERDGNNSWLCVDDNEIGISVYAKTREELIKDLNVQINVLWHGYALALDDSLSKCAKKLKSALK